MLTPRSFVALVVAVSFAASTSEAFSSGHYVAFLSKAPPTRQTSSLAMAADDTPKLEMIPPSEEGTPIPFVDLEGSSFIECYADSVATVNGVQYTIGCPCDYAVALTYFDDNGNLLPIELDDELMDDIFPIAESIMLEEFGEELTLQRTPQTLTLVGELEEDEDDMDDMDDRDDDLKDGEEEVEVLISFEHEGKEYNLVRLLDPVLLVGKACPESPARRLLLSQQESEAVMPVLEGVFLEHQDERAP